MADDVLSLKRRDLSIRQGSRVLSRAGKRSLGGYPIEKAYGHHANELCELLQMMHSDLPMLQAKQARRAFAPQQPGARTDCDAVCQHMK